MVVGILIAICAQSATNSANPKISYEDCVLTLSLVYTEGKQKKLNGFRKFNEEVFFNDYQVTGIFIIPEDTGTRKAFDTRTVDFVYTYGRFCGY